MSSLCFKDEWANGHILVPSGLHSVQREQKVMSRTLEKNPNLCFFLDFKSIQKKDLRDFVVLSIVDLALSLIHI